MTETDNPFEKVLDRLREKGWQKGGFGIAEGPNCIRGAAYEVNIDQDLVFGGYLDDKPIINIVKDQYPHCIPVRPGREMISFFNDHPDTTFSDVERVLEKAAVKWEEERALRDD